MLRAQKQHAARATSSNANLRNRASPARLVKLYKYMSEDQRKMIHEVKFDGLLKIACTTIPADFANWLMVECFDAESSELVFPRRGRISVTSKSMADILNLRNKGDEVKYELDVDAINFIHSKYGIIQRQAPKIEEMMERVKQNNHANEDFLRSWLKIAVSTFLCPPTSLGISPRCYLALVDLTCMKKLNWCQFVVDQLKDAARKIDKKNSVRGCFLLLVVNPLAVGNVQIPATQPRIAAWTRKLLD
ncbi:hypothetical protein GQ55_9G277500 [Panicum hallii var. hallii]|uniref:Aminotransferase-like plant mobile domain-containing protein n=1 Tax=Panicum hallii var. hallii TaxID=1504633 RepID=A0A2T7C7G8_9POAL|nr:hypothetical protein GQ55_9G277500 [Panicum hallii var. hallii]